MKKLSLLFISAFVLSACGTQDEMGVVACDPAKQLGTVARGQTVESALFKNSIKTVSGGGAEDCGQVGASLDPATGISCSISATQAQRGFYLMIEQRDQKSKDTYWEAWVKTQYPSGRVEPIIMVYRQYSNGTTTAQECLKAQPVSSAIVRKPFDCAGLMDRPEKMALFSQARGCN